MERPLYVDPDFVRSLALCMRTVLGSVYVDPIWNPPIKGILVVGRPGTRKRAVLTRLLERVAVQLHFVNCESSTLLQDCFGVGKQVEAAKGTGTHVLILSHLSTLLRPSRREDLDQLTEWLKMGIFHLSIGLIDTLDYFGLVRAPLPLHEETPFSKACVSLRMCLPEIMYMPAPPQEYRILYNKWVIEQFCSAYRAQNPDFRLGDDIVEAVEVVAKAGNFATFLDLKAFWQQITRYVAVRSIMLLDLALVESFLVDLKGGGVMAIRNADLRALETEYSTACGKGPKFIEDHEARAANARVLREKRARDDAVDFLQQTEGKKAKEGEGSSPQGK